ncbi:MAG: DUF1499 domain-containing protein [Elainella sp. Prado103]|jgi:uncharacterized protein (DUF1499 family)|nr:DUF1499 domain-containing protein [Elainella sp. Prado103]
MVQSRFSGLVAFLLMVVCTLSFTLATWLGTIAPIAAQPLQSPLNRLQQPSTLLSNAPTREIAMGSKPLFSFSGKRPTNLGITAGKLSACPSSPNCVNSQTPTGDAEHSIAPIAYKSASSEVIPKLKAVIEGMERTKIVTETADYLYAEFTSALMGYVDDVEFYLDPTTPGQLQVRSASRLGQSDLGVNRKRIEEIRSQLMGLEV